MAIEFDGLSRAAADTLRRFSTAGVPLTRDPAHEPNAAQFGPLDPTSLFPNARDPLAAVSGLWLILGCWQRSHEISQNIDSREGSYWHAIAHRIEPDTPNAGYWFRRVSEHPIFPELHTRAAAILDAHENLGWRLGERWDPQQFLEWCDDARQGKSSEAITAAAEIQDTECNLLLHWCAAPPLIR
ncbi:MAG TPA: hypothetical protein VHZ55_27045 [Bryobacteraceae bacterium]|jgi:hypothetical protein|nr:hypothetical protein [Bryobacteraceae bacterium]